ncbi:GNAT family N-acetyltransferase [Francisella sp. Scap27]|nr:GNAT family N-acetyltransferase [Francisella sp. Scap27]
MVIRISDNICLEKLLLTDADKIFQLVEENRETFHYLDWVSNVRCVISAQEYISKRILNTSVNSEWFKITLNGKVVGVFGIKYICYDKSESEIGYWLAKKAQGYGVISQSISSIKKHLRKKRVKTIKISCISENKNAIAVAIKAEGVRVNVVKNYKSINGKIFNLNVYSIRL